MSMFGMLRTNNSSRRFASSKSISNRALHPAERPVGSSMSTPDRLGGIIHTYQKFDPINFPSPTAPPPDVVSRAFEHLLFYGNTRRLTEEELARAIHLDPSQIIGLGPSLEALIEILRERKRKILATYETEQAQHAAERAFHDPAADVRPPGKLAKRFQQAVQEEQLHDLE